MRALNARIPTVNYHRPRQSHGWEGDAQCPRSKECSGSRAALGSINTQLLPFNVPVSSGQALSIWCLGGLKEHHLAFAGRIPFKQSVIQSSHYSDDMQKVLSSLLNAPCYPHSSHLNCTIEAVLASNRLHGSARHAMR